MIRDEELAYLENGGRCETCPHYVRLHDFENGDCPIDKCDCGLKRFEKEHAGHALVEHEGGGSRGPHVGWGYAIQPPYIECVDCRTSIAREA